MTPRRGRSPLGCRSCWRSCAYPPSPGCGPNSSSGPTARAGPAPVSWLCSPNWKWPSAHADASNAISTRRGCRRTRRSTTSTSTHVPTLSRARVMALAAGDAWLNKGSNVMLFGPPGSGKSHISAALGRALVENGYRVLFTRTTDIVQRLQAARQELALEAAIAKLERYDLLVLDDLSYARRDQAETSVLFELISKRYERRSMLITANQPFGEWNKVFPDAAMTIACRRQTRPPLDHHRDERRKLPAAIRHQTQSPSSSSRHPTHRRHQHRRTTNVDTCQRQSPATII